MEPDPSGAVDVLILRLDAPLLSFGGIAVDENRPTAEFPGRAMLTGLLANALGWYHQDAEALNQLQARLVYAARQERPGQLLEDFQTVDLGQDFLREGWTTHGRPETRGKGSATQTTHIRRRWYLADAAYTIALTLDPASVSPTLDDLERALLHPARPLFLGRKACLPSRPLLGHRHETDRLHAASPLAALASLPRWSQGDGPKRLKIWWPDAAEDPRRAPVAVPGVLYHRSLPVVDDRDWRHQFHAGRRFLHEGELEISSSLTGEGAHDA